MGGAVRKVFVVDAAKPDRDLAARFLSDGGYVVSPAPDVRAARALLEKGAPDLLLLDTGLGAGAYDLIKGMRAAESRHHVYVLMTSAKMLASEFSSGLAVGADDFIRKPLSRDELLLRASMPERIARWAKDLFGSPRAVDLSESNAIDKLSAWKELPTIAATDLEPYVGAPLALAAAEDAISSAAYVADIALTLAVEETEVYFRVGVEAASMAQISKFALESEDAADDLKRDIVREFANTVGGAFKRRAASEEVVMALGLPSDVTDTSTFEDGKPRRDVWLATADGAIRIGLSVCVRRKGLRRVRVAQLREGMVLAREFRNAAGALLLPAGRLTLANIERASRHLASDTLLEVTGAD